MSIKKSLLFIIASSITSLTFSTQLDDILTKLINNMHTIAYAKNNLNKKQGFQLALYGANKEAETFFQTHSINPKNELNAFFKVAAYGDENLLSLFLKNGFKLDTCFEHKTLLQQATLFYNVSMVQTLTNKKAPFITESNMITSDKMFLGALSKPLTQSDQKSILARERYGKNPHLQCHKIISTYIAS